MYKTDRSGPVIKTLFRRYSREFVVTEFDCRNFSCLLFFQARKDQTGSQYNLRNLRSQGSHEDQQDTLPSLFGEQRLFICIGNHG